MKIIQYGANLKRNIVYVILISVHKHPRTFAIITLKDNFIKFLGYI